MKIRVQWLLPFAALALASCESEQGGGKGCNVAGNPLDAELCAEFETAGYQPIQASNEELCTRLYVDLMGSRPTVEEAAVRCHESRDLREIVRSMQRTDAYRETARRRWADRFKYSDYMVDVESIHDLDALVERLYRHRILYPDFAVEALAHPGFVGRFIGYGQPQNAADAAFQAFLGRKATTPEAIDLGNLWRPWNGGSVIVDGDMPATKPAFTGPDAPYYGYGQKPWIDPFACEAGVRSCETTILGFAEVRFPRRGRAEMLSPDMLTADDWDALRAPGRFIVTLPMFWEAQVDETLKTFLGYDLGSMRPGARQALVRWFRSTGGDVPRLERMVVTSWAYRQTAIEDTAHPRPESLRTSALAYGPTKLILPEAWLKSVGKLTGRDPGSCDWRYPNLPNWYYPGDAQLDAMLDDVYPRLADGTIDRRFRDMAAAMGGCPGTFDYGAFGARERSHQMGLMTAVAQEEAAISLCLTGPVPGLLPAGIDPEANTLDSRRAVIRHVLEGATGRGMPGAEIEDLAVESLDGCPTCGAEALARDLCVGLTGGVEYVFY